MNRAYIIILFLIVFLFSCKKLKEYATPPELAPLQYGLKTSAAIGYCASIAMSAFKGETLPGNIVFLKKGKTDNKNSSGLIYIHVDNNHPVPFNAEVGEIVIAGLWDEEDAGVVSIILADIDIMQPKFKFYGFYTVPVIIRDETGTILSLFARQDIIMGEGSDTILSLSMTDPQFNLEKMRAESEKPEDVFAAVKQNVWFVDINQNNTASDFYDDTYIVNGGGQIVEATSLSGGILYHAMIETKINYTVCNANPYSGVALIQNLKAGEIIDLGTILLDFHDECDGKVYINAATGIYFKSNKTTISLDLN